MDQANGIKDYRVQGAGPGLLLLPGATGSLQLLEPQIHHFQKRFRVIAPSYPPVPTMTQLVDDISRLLEQEGVTQTNVAGGSYGGLVAQAFARRYPRRVIKLVLSHTGAPDPDRAVKLERVLKFLQYMPDALLRILYKRRMSTLLPKSRDGAPIDRRKFDASIERLTREDIVRSFERVVDFDRHFVFKPGEGARFIPVLLIMADDDPTTPVHVRARMGELYPHAETYVFHGTGHAAPLLKPEEYLGVLDRFLGD